MKNSFDVPGTISPTELAQTLGISRRHLVTLEQQRRIPRPFRLGRCVRWSRREIEDWLAAGAPTREDWELRRPRGAAERQGVER